MFSVNTRKQNIEKLGRENFDLVIVGGGITGAGVARDAASRGMRVALVEASDFASGTSSRSSKLVHGGIRYLENLEFGLVFEALSERNLLFEIAPLMVHPLRFVLPIYENSRVGMFKMSLGMWLYDALALFNSPEMHERLNFEETKERLPLLSDSGLKGSFVYSDAYMDDDRMVIETLRSAAVFGAISANYVRVTENKKENGRVRSLSCQDEETGKEFEIRGTHFVSAVGPWTDIFGKSNFKGWKSKLRPTKGIHFTLNRERLGLKEAVVMADDSKNRIVFGIPRHDMVIVGTTDTDFSKDPSDVTSDREDIEYLLKMCGEYFPGANISEKDILGSYAGVRPLVHDGSESEGKTSREHKIWTDFLNVTFVAGGKYTTYRKMSEDIVNECLSYFSTEYVAGLKPTQTRNPLNLYATEATIQKANSLCGLWAEESGLSKTNVQALVGRHGLEAERILQKTTSRMSYWDYEVDHAVDTTMCFHLEDFFLRRTHLFLAHPDNGMSLVDQIGRRLAEKLNWSDSQFKDEIARLKNHLNKELSWKK